MDIITERIRGLREEREMKQGALAKELGISQAVISNYENGRNPPYDVLFKYMEYFDVSADYILGFSTERKPAVTDVTRLISLVGKSAEKNQATNIVMNEDILSMFQLLREYYRAGAPGGNQPMDTLHGFIKSFSSVLEASNAGDGIALLQAINNTVSSTFDLSDMLTGFVEEKDQK